MTYMTYNYDFKPFYYVRKMQHSAVMIFLTTNEENTHSLSNSYQMLPAGAYVCAKEFKGQLKQSVLIVREEECAVLKQIEQPIELLSMALRGLRAVSKKNVKVNRFSQS